MQTLNQILNDISARNKKDFKSHVPVFIYSNLKTGFGQRPYQQEAFGRFTYYWDELKNKTPDSPVHLLYHMATGSGKTLVMAGLIIYLYEKGYRNFLFFVNSTNIIDKTKDNFFNAFSSKYLFANKILINGKQIKITLAENFQVAGTDDITIVFSTIQGLHSRLNMPCENSLTYEDFENNRLVLISDEAHHINAETKKGVELTTDEKNDMVSWEGTTGKILRANTDNVLLEFTATADLSVPEIRNKYSDKLIFDYPLRQFRKDGYSKDVKLMQSDLPVSERILQAVILSQYRRKIFEKHRQLIKPVILFKSKTIKESQSFLEMFETQIRNLQPADIEKIEGHKTDLIIKKVFKYLEANNISPENFVRELKVDFSADKLISINSKDESLHKQSAINSLEDEHNEYRAIFAVDKLNEGWDVLNLFDIVRLYDTKDYRMGKPGKTTMAEAQLIGRGARYCPFQIDNGQYHFKRKFDNDSENELRICEELYYHSIYNPQYIRELNTALEQTGIVEKWSEKKNTEQKTPKQTSANKKFSLNVRKEFADAFSDMRKRIFSVTLKTGFNVSSGISDHSAHSLKLSGKQFRLSDFEVHIIRKAMSRSEQYNFSNIKKRFPEISSVSEFIKSEKYLGGTLINISGLPGQPANLSPEYKMQAVTEILKSILLI